MSVFKELSFQYKQHRLARLDQLARLADQCQRLGKALENYLQLPSKTWVDPQTGSEMSYVRIGKGDAHKFEEVNPYELSSLNGKLEFAISVTLESAPGEFPKIHSIFRLAVEAKLGGYEFTSKDFSGNFRVPKGDDAEHVYEGICTALVGQLKAACDTDRIY